MTKDAIINPFFIGRYAGDKDIRNNTALSASDVNDFYYENLNN